MKMHSHIPTLFWNRQRLSDNVNTTLLYTKIFVIQHCDNFLLKSYVIPTR